MRNHFDEQLILLNSELEEMGAMCEEVIASAAKALMTGDESLIKKITDTDSGIDQMERTIESLCLKLLLRQQPVANDLRLISAALKMITDMERIGDQAADIADIIRHLDGATVKECECIGKMAEATIKIVTASIDAFIKRDLSAAKIAALQDDIVDNYFEEAKTSLIKLIYLRPQDGSLALDLLMIAKYFERIGDHAVNIAEWVIFSITGEHKSF